MGDHELLLRQLYQAVDDEDFDTLCSLITDDVRYLRPGYEPIQGCEAFREFYTRHRLLDRGVHRIKTVLVVEDDAVVEGVFEGSYKDGSPAKIEYVDVLRFNGEHIAERRTYFAAPLA